MLQLQQELNNREKTRDDLAQELALMINSNQELLSRLEQVDRLQLEFQDLKTKYNALLQVRNPTFPAIYHSHPSYNSFSCMIYMADVRGKN